jgi:serpin B
MNLPVSQQEFVYGSNQYSFSFLASCYKYKDENIIISPFSLNSALSMTVNGAAGSTKQAMLKAMGFEDGSIEDLNNHYRDFSSALLNADTSVRLIMANSIWYRNIYTLNTQFSNVNEDYYNAYIKDLDFQSSLSPGIIDNWISEKTDNLIKDVIKEIKKEDVMFLINTLYYNAKWAEGYKFKESHAGNFHSDENNVIVTMMENREQYNCYFGDTFSAVTIPYGNQAFEFIAFMPTNGNTMNTLMGKLSDVTFYNTIMSSFSKELIGIRLPKFKFKYDLDLIDFLKERGMSIAFDKELASFPGIFNEENRLYISSAKQFNYIEVNENGTEAASATSIVVSATSAPNYKIIEFNRPFIFIIREKSSGIIIFAGYVNNPNAG